MRRVCQFEPRRGSLISGSSHPGQHEAMARVRESVDWSMLWRVSALIWLSVISAIGGVLLVFFAVEHPLMGFSSVLVCEVCEFFGFVG